MHENIPRRGIFKKVYVNSLNPRLIEQPKAFNLVQTNHNLRNDKNTHKRKLQRQNCLVRIFTTIGLTSEYSQTIMTPMKALI